MPLLDTVLVERREQVKAAVMANKGQAVAHGGSVARGDCNADSDYDFVVTFQPKSSLLDHARMELALEDILGCSVDVIDRDALKSSKETSLNSLPSLRPSKNAPRLPRPVDSLPKSAQS